MSYKISKELFEAVMSLKVIEFYCRNEIQYYPADKERVRCIDWIPKLSGCEYNDFFFKCKEWAFEQAYQLESCKTNKLLEDNKFESIYMCGGFYQYSVIQNFYASSEQQAVFDACMYILDKDKQ